MSTTMTTRIVDWSAKRAGGGITITGRNADTGEPVRIVGVDTIRSRTNPLSSRVLLPPVAADRDGVQYVLA